MTLHAEPNIDANTTSLFFFSLHVAPDILRGIKQRRGEDLHPSVAHASHRVLPLEQGHLSHGQSFPSEVPHDYRIYRCGSGSRGTNWWYEYYMYFV